MNIVRPVFGVCVIIFTTTAQNYSTSEQKMTSTTSRKSTSSTMLATSSSSESSKVEDQTTLSINLELSSGDSLSTSTTEGIPTTFGVSSHEPPSTSTTANDGRANHSWFQLDTTSVSVAAACVSFFCIAITVVCVKRKRSVLRADVIHDSEDNEGVTERRKRSEQLPHSVTFEHVSEINDNNHHDANMVQNQMSEDLEMIENDMYETSNLRSNICNMAENHI